LIVISVIVLTPVIVFSQKSPLVQPGQGWFLAVASFKAHLKLVFFDGASLTPVPRVHLATKPHAHAGSTFLSVNGI
jgi:hypothetical protein